MEIGYLQVGRLLEMGHTVEGALVYTFNFNPGALKRLATTDVPLESQSCMDIELRFELPPHYMRRICKAMKGLDMSLEEFAERVIDAVYYEVIVKGDKK